MENTEAQVYSEVYALIKLAGKDYENMLPDKVMKIIDIKRDRNYTPIYSIDIPLEKQNIQKDSLAMLANIEYNYWCKTENEKRQFLNELKQIDIDSEKKLRELYNPDNIFRKNNQSTQNNTEEVAMIEVKEEKWYRKVFEFFRKMFKKGDNKN